ncbi:hypothetical protein HOD29_02190 [archaeon]|jgi:hypothetical protein|nr:hypothetical protein [archaeon]
MKARDNIFILIIGVVISVASIVLALFKIKLWYFAGVFGLWFLFDYLTSMKKKDTTIQLFIKDKKTFFNLYLVLLAVGMSIEYIGRFLLGWWHYTSPKYLEIFVILYPFMLFSLREMYESTKMFLKNRVFAFIAAMVIGIIIWELPNLISLSWIYAMPFGFEIVGINIIVIIGWALLIGIPLYVYDMLLGKKGTKK